MRKEVQSALGIIDFIFPFDVVAGVGLVFTAEHILEAYIESGEVAWVWVQLYIIFSIIIAGMRLVTADEEEMDDLEEDIDELTD